MRLSAGRYNSFVVRIWNHNGGLVQGQITHVATGQSLYFRDPQRMLAFIHKFVEPGEPWPIQAAAREER